MNELKLVISLYEYIVIVKDLYEPIVGSAKVRLQIILLTIYLFIILMKMKKQLILMSLAGMLILG